MTKTVNLPDDWYGSDAADTSELENLRAGAADLVADFDDLPDGFEGPTCSICDALGHGYPGAGPCPLEVADYSDEPWWAQ